MSYVDVGRTVAIGPADVVSGVNGRASSVGIDDLRHHETGRIIAVGLLPVPYEESRAALIGDACARYDVKARVTAIGWDPILYRD